MRVNAHALILRDVHVLLVKFDDENGVHYNLPGGKIEKGEAAHEACVRETLEETGARVEPGELVLGWEYVPEHEGFLFGKKRKLGLLFRCGLKPGAQKFEPESPDDGQVGCEWISFENLGKMSQGKFPPLYPKIEREILDVASGRVSGVRFVHSKKV